MANVLTRGLHPARCCQVIDLGTQAPYGKSTGKAHRKYWLSFEVPGFIAKEGKDYPATIGGEYGPYDLRSLAENWRTVAFTAEQAEAFDPKGLLGVAALVSVIRYTKKNGDVALKLGAVNPMISALVAENMKSKPLHFDMADGMFDKAAFDSLPEFIRKKIEVSPEYKAIMGHSDPADPQEREYADAAIGDDNLPF